MRAPAHLPRFAVGALFALAAAAPAMARPDVFSQFSSPSPQSCAQACAGEALCASWSHVPPQTQPARRILARPLANPTGVCSLSTAMTPMAEPGGVAGRPPQRAAVASASPRMAAGAPSRVGPARGGGQGGAGGWAVQPAPWLSPGASAPTRAAAMPPQAGGAPLALTAPPPPAPSNARVTFDPPAPPPSMAPMAPPPPLRAPAPPMVDTGAFAPQAPASQALSAQVERPAPPPPPVEATLAPRPQPGRGAPRRSAGTATAANPFDPESFRGPDGMIDAAAMRRAQLAASAGQGQPSYSVEREWGAVAAEQARARAAGEPPPPDPLLGTVPIAPPETPRPRRAPAAEEAQSDAPDAAPEAAPPRRTPGRGVPRSAASREQVAENARPTGRGPLRKGRAPRADPPQALDREPRLNGGPPGN